MMRLELVGPFQGGYEKPDGGNLWRAPAGRTKIEDLLNELEDYMAATTLGHPEYLYIENGKGLVVMLDASIKVAEILACEDWMCWGDLMDWSCVRVTRKLRDGETMLQAVQLPEFFIGRPK